MTRINIFGTCSHCLSTSNILASPISHIGGLGECRQCGCHVANHQCNHPSARADWWLPVLESGISASCPSCGAVMRFAKQIQSTPNLPDWVGQAAGIAFGVALLIGVAKFVDGFLGRGAKSIRR